MHAYRTFVGVVSLVLLLAGWLSATQIFAQPPAFPPLPNLPTEEQLKLRMATPVNQFPAPRTPLNDPTIPSPEIRKLITPEETPVQSPVGPRAATSSSLPNIRLKARITARGRTGLATLDVGGVLVTIREGDTLPVRAGNNSAIKCTKLTAQEIELEIGDRQQVLIVN